MTTTVTLNADQDEIREVARRFLRARFPADRVRELMTTEAGYAESSWREIADLGWLGIALPEAQGGTGYTIIERCLLLEEMGQVLCPVPFLSSAVLATDAIAHVADEELGTVALAGIVDGSTTATLIAAGDLLSSPTPAGGVVASGSDHRLRGRGGLTIGGGEADLLIVAATLPDGGTGLFSVDPAGPGVERAPAQTVDETRKTARVTFDGAPAARLDRGDRTAEKLAYVLDRGAISLAAEMVGGAQQALELTVAYMKEREQFGRPIGTFQALKHRLADLFVAIDGAREAVYAACDVVVTEQFEHLRMAAAVAKQAASQSYVVAAAEAIQLHGGIGFTEEHDIGLYYKRAVVAAATLGTPLAHIERIAHGLDV